MPRIDESWADVDLFEPLTGQQVRDVTKLWTNHGGLMDGERASIPERRFWEFVKTLTSQASWDHHAEQLGDISMAKVKAILGKRP